MKCLRSTSLLLFWLAKEYSKQFVLEEQTARPNDVRAKSSYAVLKCRRY